MIKKFTLKNWIPVVILMLIIFIFSSQPASQSNNLSYGFTKVLVDVLGEVLPFNIETSTINVFLTQLNHIIRKLAHFTIYLILGIFVTRALIKDGVKSKVNIIAFLICVLYAISDEFHQLYVPGRGGQLKDVLIDSAGSLVGITISKAYIALRKEKSY